MPVELGSAELADVRWTSWPIARHAGRVVAKERGVEVRNLLAVVERWAAQQSDVRAVAVVGSWARGDARMDSDVDLVVLTDDPDRYVKERAWIESAVGEDAPIVRTVKWGDALTERRLRLESGLEVEFGFASPAWAGVDPLDPGTAGVIRNGTQALLDSESILQRLMEASMSDCERRQP